MSASHEITFHEVLGTGGAGVVVAGNMKGRDVAIKLYGQLEKDACRRAHEVC